MHRLMLSTVRGRFASPLLALHRKTALPAMAAPEWHGGAITPPPSQTLVAPCGLPMSTFLTARVLCWQIGALSSRRSCHSSRSGGFPKWRGAGAAVQCPFVLGLEVHVV